ncbi:MAG: hypothetical protein BGN87_08305 [Rhizobiales bacterium 65-79]|jgi:hypothetical protein|nr:MAG: hypothetical protein BGN87_08305 [Rhizobiales bacterium 65-79]
MDMTERSDIAAAIERLCSLHDGDSGVLDVIKCGRAAIPALCTVLFQREPSGLFATRCRAVQALAALKAHDPLVQFLSDGHVAADPVERMGDEAVMDTAARALAKGRRDDVAFHTLLRLAEARPYLSGVIEALGALERTEAIPVLAGALTEDGSRQAAAAAILQLGRAALPTLIPIAKAGGPFPAYESHVSRKKRKGVLELIETIGIRTKDWPSLRSLVRDSDPQVAFVACRICMEFGPRRERSGAERRMGQLLLQSDAKLEDEIETYLGLQPVRMAAGDDNPSRAGAGTSSAMRHLLQGITRFLRGIFRLDH